jgi:hypothetical protein
MGNFKPTIMKTIMLKTMTTLLIMVACFAVQAQEITAQSASPLKPKGFIVDVVYGDDQTVSLIYSTKITNKVCNAISYKFDKDLKFVSQEPVEIPLEKLKRLKNYKGDEYVWETLELQEAKNNKMEVLKVRYTYKYSWWKLDYKVSRKVLDKEKYEDASGNSVTPISFAYNPATKQIICLAKPFIKDKVKLQFRYRISGGGSLFAEDQAAGPAPTAHNEFYLITFDNTLKKVKEEKISFTSPHIAKVQFIVPKEGETGNAKWPLSRGLTEEMYVNMNGRKQNPLRIDFSQADWGAADSESYPAKDISNNDQTLMNDEKKYTTENSDILMVFRPENAAGVTANLQFIRVKNDGSIANKAVVESDIAFEDGTSVSMYDGALYFRGVIPEAGWPTAGAVKTPTGKLMKYANNAKEWEIAGIPADYCSLDITDMPLTKYSGTKYSGMDTRVEEKINDDIFFVQESSSISETFAVPPGKDFKPNEKYTYSSDYGSFRSAMLIDMKGSLKGYYGMANTWIKNNPYKNPPEVSGTNEVVLNKDRTSAYWIGMQRLGSEKVGGEWQYMQFPIVMKINLTEKQKATPQKPLGVTLKPDPKNAYIQNFDKKVPQYFLNNTFPYILTKDNNVIFIGTDEDQKNIWLAKMPVE